MINRESVKEITSNNYIDYMRKVYTVITVNPQNITAIVLLLPSQCKNKNNKKKTKSLKHNTHIIAIRVSRSPGVGGTEEL